MLALLARDIGSCVLVWSGLGTAARAQVRESGNVRDEAERCLGGVAVFAEVHVNRHDIEQIREEVDPLTLRDGPHTQGHGPRTRPRANSLAKGLEQVRIDKGQDKPPKDDDILTGIIAGR